MPEIKQCMEVGAEQQTILHSVRGCTSVWQEVSGFECLNGIATANRTAPLVSYDKRLSELPLTATPHDLRQSPLSGIDQVVDIKLLYA